MTLAVPSTASISDSAANPSSHSRVRRETQIKQRHRRGIGLKNFKRPFSVFRQKDFVILAQRPFHLSPDGFVVIDDEQFVFHHLVSKATLPGKLCRCRARFLT